MKKKIEKLMSKGRIERAMKELMKYMENNDTDIYDELKQIHTNYKNIVNKNMMSLVSDDDLRKAEAKLIYSIRNYINDIEEDNSNTNNTTVISGNNNVVASGSNIKNSKIGASNTGKSSNKIIKRVLFLASNPDDTGKLQLAEEFRIVSERLQIDNDKIKFELYQKWAVTTNDLQEAILKYNPNIIHFSGHGKRGKSFRPELSGIILQNSQGKSQVVKTKALSNMFDLFSSDDSLNIEALLFNACYSKNQAEPISKFIPFVIGMEDAVDDNDAVEFAMGFYTGLAYGKDIEYSFKLGKSKIEIEQGNENIVVLHKKDGF